MCSIEEEVFRSFFDSVGIQDVVACNRSDFVAWALLIQFIGSRTNPTGSRYSNSLCRPTGRSPDKVP